jgi:leader peptidase (prepilin peptidase)/N-methyltransferase
MSVVPITGLAIGGFCVAVPQRVLIARYGQRQPPPLVVIGSTTAVLLGVTGYCVHSWAVLVATGWFVICAVPLAFIDARLHRLPDVLTGPAYAGVMVCLIVAAATMNAWVSLGRAVLGGAILASCYLAVAVISRGQIGLGDVKAAASAGSLMAWFSWQTVLAGTAASLVLAAGYGLVLLAARRATLKTHIAYGPALVAGTLLTVMLASHAHTG